MTRSITSSVWGNVPAQVNTEHEEDVRPWNPDCAWYDDFKDYCLDGCQHPGVDINVNFVNIYAARAGVVMLAGSYPNNYEPNVIRIEVANGEQDVYGHLSSIHALVIEGQPVAQGQLLGVSGSAGTGPHLHFEVRRPDSSCNSGMRCIDPEKVLTGSIGVSDEIYYEGDRIRVSAGPANLRSNPSITATIITSLATNTELCVKEGPINADGYTWFRVKVAAGTTFGWIADANLRLVAAGGCIAFSPNDKIKVAEGPLNLRRSASSTSAVVAVLATNSQLCVIEGPRFASAIAWYKVKVSTSGDIGWVAASYCDLVQTNGCAANGPVPIPKTGFNVGDTIAVTDGPLNLRATAGTGGTLVATLPDGTKGVLLQGPTSANGYKWYQIDTRVGSTTYRGWVASAYIERFAAPNLVDNPTARVNLTNIAALDANTTISIVNVNSDNAVKVINGGLAADQGVKYSSATIALAGQRFFSAVVDVYGTGVIDWSKLRVMYSDGSSSTYSNANASVTLASTAWKRIITPVVASNAAKTVSKVEVWVRRQGSAAQTFYTDNAKIVEL